ARSLLLHSFPTRRSSDLDLACAGRSAVRMMSSGTNWGSARASAWRLILSYMPGTSAVSGHVILREGVRSNVFHLKYRLPDGRQRSEEHTSELQSRSDLVC